MNVDAVLAMVRARPLQQASARDVSRAFGCTTRVAHGHLSVLALNGLARPTGLRDRYGWAIYGLIRPRPITDADVRAARRNRNPLRSLVIAGCLPVKRAAERLGIEREA